MSTEALPGRPPLRILHTSDCHLGASAEMRWAVEATFEQARSLLADALLIVGDVFDHPRVPASELEWLAARLSEAAFPVVILPGNHDALTDGGVYDRLDTAACPNVVILRNEDGVPVRIPGLPLTVWGRPTVEHTSDFRPLAGLPRRPAEGWAIAMAHGSVESGDDPTHRGSPIYQRDLAAVDWDYVALGHADRFQDVSLPGVPAFYPGNTASSREGQPGGILVELTAESGVQVCWVPFAAHRAEP